MSYVTVEDTAVTVTGRCCGSATPQRNWKGPSMWITLPAIIDLPSAYSVVGPAGSTISALPGISTRCMPSTVAMACTKPSVAIAAAVATKPPAMTYQIREVTPRACHGTLDEARQVVELL